MQPELIDLSEVLLLMVVPVLVLLACRFLNRSWDRAAAVNEADDAVGAPYQQGG